MYAKYNGKEYGIIMCTEYHWITFRPHLMISKPAWHPNDVKVIVIIWGTIIVAHAGFLYPMRERAVCNTDTQTQLSVMGD